MFWCNTSGRTRPTPQQLVEQGNRMKAITAFVERDQVEQQYRGFACPHEGIDLSFLEDSAIRHSRRIVRTFLSRMHELLAGQEEGLSAVMQDWLARRSSFDDVWDLSFSRARMALPSWYDDLEDFPRLAAALALRLHHSGAEGEWSVQLSSPTRLRWGRWLLPPADHLAVHVNTGQAHLQLTHQRQISEVRMWLTRTGWEAQGAELLPALHYQERDITLLLPSDPESLHFVDTRPEMKPGVLERIIQGYTVSFDLLHDYAPIYLPWVKKTVRQLVPTKSTPNEMLGGSNVGWSGAVHLSYDIEPVAIAEMLAHEATHQYFALACQVGKIADISDPTRYYSPAVDADRSIYYILLTYHAFGNVALFYRLCREHGLVKDSTYMQEHEERLLPWLEHYEKILVGNQALTLLGRALWEPIAERLN